MCQIANILRALFFSRTMLYTHMHHGYRHVLRVIRNCCASANDKTIITYTLRTYIKWFNRMTCSDSHTATNISCLVISTMTAKWNRNRKTEKQLGNFSLFSDFIVFILWAAVAAFAGVIAVILIFYTFILDIKCWTLTTLYNSEKKLNELVKINIIAFYYTKVLCVVSHICIHISH